MKGFKIEDYFPPNDEYKCTLSKEYQQVALEELREEPQLRQQAIEQMRKWIAQNPSIVSCRTDAIYLLRYLRTRKFSIQLACKNLENVLVIREQNMNWFKNYDPFEPTTAELFRTGAFLKLPNRDKNGRCVVILRNSAIDPYRHSAYQIYRAMGMLHELLQDDEMNQIAGYTVITDNTNIKAAFVGMFNISDLRYIFKIFQGSNTQRIKKIIINVPPAAWPFIELVQKLFNEKFKSRLKFYKNTEELYEYVDKDNLPIEYGGKLQISDLIEHLFKSFEEKKHQFQAQNETCYRMDYSNPNCKQIVNEFQNGMGTQGSFRKLCID